VRDSAAEPDAPAREDGIPRWRVCEVIRRSAISSALYPSRSKELAENSCGAKTNYFTNPGASGSSSQWRTVLFAAGIGLWIAQKRAQTSGRVEETLQRQDISFLYADAFRNHGIDVEALEVEEAAARIRARPIHVALIAALDHWTHKRLRKMPGTDDERKWKHLWAVTQAADPNAWRHRLRSVLERSPLDKKILQDLAVSTERAWQPAQSLHLLGNYLADAGALAEAVRVLQQAQQWHPDNFWMANDPADYLQRLNKPVEALRFRSIALTLRPQSAGAHQKLGLAFLKQRALQPAIAAFNECMRLLSGDSAVDRAQYYNIAWGNVLNDKGALDEAIPAFQEASRLKPDEAGIYLNWGGALMNQGLLEQAVAAYDQALATLKKLHARQLRSASIRALLPIAATRRAEALIGLGRFAEAEQTFQEVLALDPSHHGAGTATRLCACTWATWLATAALAGRCWRGLYIRSMGRRGKSEAEASCQRGAFLEYCDPDVEN
jgi:tetratricopeptide (TPR) repeat protein